MKFLNKFKKPKLVFKKKELTFLDISAKYPNPPNIMIEDKKVKELHFYLGESKKIYVFPLLCTDIIYLSRFFPDEVEFFGNELMKIFKNIRRYERK